MSTTLATFDRLTPQHPLHEPWDQRVGELLGVPGLLRQLGADPAVVLADAGLAPNALDDPENRIPYGAWGRLFERSVDATAYPQFGLTTGRMWHLEHLGALGEVMRNCATVGEALQILTVYQHMNSSGGLAFAVKRAAVVDIGYAIYYPGITGADQIYDAVLAAAFNFLRALAGAAWTPSEVFLPHGKPRDMALYRNLFKIVPHFDSEFCALRFPAYWLDRAIEGADPQRKRVALLRAHASKPELLKQIYRGLRTLLLHGKSSGDDLAQMLSMHRRTLNRRLREHGTTFQNVLDEVRFEVARQHLCYSELSLDDIAASLGYAGVSPFMRTFHRWTGITPGQWRRRAAEERLSARAVIPEPSWGRGGQAVPIVPPQGEWRGHGRLSGTDEELFVR